MAAAPGHSPAADADQLGRWRIRHLARRLDIHRLPQHPRRSLHHARLRIRAGSAGRPRHDIRQSRRTRRHFSRSVRSACSARSGATSPMCASSFRGLPEPPRPQRLDSARSSGFNQPDGSGPGGKRGNRGASTLIQVYGISGELLFSSFVPAAPGTGGFAFLGVVIDAARIARVRIITGDLAPGPDDEPSRDIVMMDDFIYGEPRQ